MADYGMLTEVISDTRSAFLAADASVSDSQLEVDDAGDFNASSTEDPDGGGGTLLLNGVQLAYTDVTWGVTEDDTDLILLAAPLAVAADEGDSVTTIVGGLPAEDWYAVVDMGEGDNVKIPLTFAQRSQWPAGPYDSVPVQVSDDHERLEDAPGRPASAGGRAERWVDDEWTAAGDNIDSPGTLTYTPKAHALTVQQNGNRLRNSDFTLAGKVVTPLASQLVIRSSDVFQADYDYDPAAETVGVGTNPESYSDVLLALSPLWFALFNESSGTTAEDLSAGGRDGLYNGPTLGVPGIVPNLGAETAASFDGSNDNVDCQTSGSVTWLNSPGIALVEWIELDSIGTQQTIIARDDNGAYGVPAFNFYVNTAGKLVMKVWIGGVAHSVTGATVLSTGTPYMVVGRYDGAHLTVRYNAVADGSAAQTGSIDGNSLWGAQIGGHGLGGGATHFLDGTAQAPAILAALSDADCDALYAAGLAT